LDYGYKCKITPKVRNFNQKKLPKYDDNINDADTDEIAWSILTTAFPWLFNLMEEFSETEYLCGIHKGVARVISYWKEMDLLIL